MIVQVVMEELERHFLDVHQIEESLWVLGDRGQHYAPNLTMSVSPAPGGAFSYFGWLAVGDDEVVLTLKTVQGIMRHRSEKAEYRFEYCNPAFPDNLVDFVKLAAHNAQRCYELAHTRMWNRQRRFWRKS